MIHPNIIVRASGPRNAKLAAIAMAPAKQEVSSGIPLVGPSGKIFNEALDTAKTSRAAVFVTNLVQFYVDDNDLYAIPEEIMARERDRVFREIETVKPNCLLVLGGDTLDFLTASSISTTIPKKGKYKGQPRLETFGAKEGIIKWRGSIFEIVTPRGHRQKCVAAMHSASFIRGQWKWLPLFKYIDVPRAVTQSSFPEMRLTSREAIVGPSFKIASDYLRYLNEQEWVSVDYEGTSHITCLGAGASNGQAICVPLNRVGRSSYWTVTEEMSLWKLWCQLMRNPKVKKIAQNAGYEWIKSWLYGIYPFPLGLDTMLAHHSLYPDWGGAADEWTKRKRSIDNPGHGLALITSQYTDQPYYKDDGRHWTPSLGEEVFWRYNALDVMVTYESAMKMKAELESVGLWEAYERDKHGPFYKTLQMEWDGIAIDLERREVVRAETLEALNVARTELQDLLGMQVVTKQLKKGKRDGASLNLASPAQMQAFYQRIGYKIPVDRKTGRPSVNKDTLEGWAIQGDRRIELILTCRKLQDFTNDVLDMKLDANGRTHCHFSIGGTNGQRWSSSRSILGTGTNLQNLARQGPARSLFLPS